MNTPQWNAMNTFSTNSVLASGEAPTQEECAAQITAATWRQSNMLCGFILAGWCFLCLYSLFKWSKPFFKGRRATMAENFYHFVLIQPFVILRIATFSARMSSLTFNAEMFRLSLQLINPGFVPLFVLYMMVVLEWIFFSIQTLMMKRGRSLVPDLGRTGKVVQAVCMLTCFLVFGGIMLFGMVYRIENTGDPSLNTWVTILLAACGFCVLSALLAYILVVANLLRLDSTRIRIEAVGRFTRNIAWISISMVIKNLYFALSVFGALDMDIYSSYVFLFISELVTAYYIIDWVEAFHQNRRTRFKKDDRFFEDWDFGMSKLFFLFADEDDNTIYFFRGAKQKISDDIEQATQRFRQRSDSFDGSDSLSQKSDIGEKEMSEGKKSTV